MKRDIELVRKILLAVENSQTDTLIDGYDDDTIKYHKALVIEKGLADGSVLKSNTEIPAAVGLVKLTSLRVNLRSNSYPRLLSIT